MKTRRQAKILEIIKEHSVETQTDLLNMLRSDGFNVTQATVSRDIKEMRLVKVLSNDGTYKYATENNASSEEISHSYLLSTAIESIDYAHCLVVIKTQSGMAQAVCAALDSTHRIGILGSIAGDDTIFIATRTDAASLTFVSELKKIIKNNSFT